MTPLCLIASYGLCFLLMNDKVAFLTTPLRWSGLLNRMLSCSFCTGFHTGWVVWLLMAYTGVGWDVSEHTVVGNVGHLLLFSLASAAFCYLADVVAMKMES